MKTVILLAGKGARMAGYSRGGHKALIPISGKPLLSYLLDRLLSSGTKEIVPILGYKSEDLLNFFEKYYRGKIKIDPVYNPRFEQTNNLYSLFCARSKLEGEEFVVCNGDLILNKNILAKISKRKEISEISIDDFQKKIIDSPGTIVRKKRIIDLGRHIPHSSSYGYAIGVYKFNSSLSGMFFKTAEKALKKNPELGFHDPLRELFKKTPVYVNSTQGLSWTDLDVKEDIYKVGRVLDKIIEEEAAA